MKGDRIDILEKILFQAGEDGESPLVPDGFTANVMASVRATAKNREDDRLARLYRYLAPLAAFGAAAAAVAVFYVMADDTIATAALAAGLGSGGKSSLLALGLLH